MTFIQQVISNNQEAIAKEEFWKEHTERQKASGLSRKDYCLEHQLSYKQFGYWERKKQRQLASSDLMPVAVQRPELIMNNTRGETTVCTLVFKNGYELKIHDKAVLALLPLWS